MMRGMPALLTQRALAHAVRWPSLRGTRVAAIASASLCAVALTLQSAPSRAEHVVGVFAPLTGPLAPIGRSMRNGVVLALEQAEDAGRFGEVRLSIRGVNDDGAPKEVAERVARFVRDEFAILVIGPAISTHAEATADLANHAKFPLLAPGASEGINAAGKWAFRLTMSPYKTLHALAARALAGAAAGAVIASGRRLALVHAKGNPGFASQVAEFRAAAGRGGARVVAELTVDVTSDFLLQDANTLRESGADMIFFAMDAEPAAALARAVVAPFLSLQGGLPQNTPMQVVSNAKRPLFIFSPAAAQPALARIGGEALEGALTAADYLPDARSENNERFRAAYRTRFGGDVDAWAGLGYAAGQIAAEAIRNAGPNPDPETVRLALERVNQVEVLVGQGRWQQDAMRNPTYTPQLYVMRQGKLEALK